MCERYRNREFAEWEGVQTGSCLAAVKVEERVGAVGEEDLEGALLQQEPRVVQLRDGANRPALVCPCRLGRRGRPHAVGPPSAATAAEPPRRLFFARGVPHEMQVQVGEAQRARHHVLGCHQLAGCGEDDLHRVATEQSCQSTPPMDLTQMISLLCNS